MEKGINMEQRNYEENVLKFKNFLIGIIKNNIEININKI